MADADQTKRHQILPRDQRDAKRKSEPIKKNVRSTKPKQIPLEVPKTATLQGQKARDIYKSVYKVRNTVFYNQTGQLPTRSQRGNNYIMVMLEIDSNTILVETIKNRKYEELTWAYRAMMLRLRRAVIIPRKHILDNEVSEALKTIIKDEYKTKIELVPPCTNRRNAAEFSIRNFKAHFLSILAGNVPDFPPSLWDSLLTQSGITINLLRQSNATPNVLVYAHLSGPFNYKKIPMALMGISVQVHEKIDTRGTWAYHNVEGWYLAT